MKKPEFIYLGYDKSGSTWLYKNLNEHPDVSVPASKETFYFDRNYSRGMKWYESFFDSSKKVAIDISHDYIFDGQALINIKKDLPGVKCIVFIRNPIYKAWSLYKFAKRNSQVKGSLLEAIHDSPGILKRSYYYEDLMFARELFGENLKVFFFDDLENDPDKFFSDVSEYLGIDSSKVGSTKEVINKSSESRFKLISHLYKPAVAALRSCGAHKVVGWLKSSSLVHNILFKENKQNITNKEFEILAAHFEQDVNKLSKLLGVDLSSWLTRH